MAEIKTAFEFKDLKAQAITLLSGTDLVKLYTPQENTKVNIRLEIIETTAEQV